MENGMSELWHELILAEKRPKAVALQRLNGLGSLKNSSPWRIRQSGAAKKALRRYRFFRMNVAFAYIPRGDGGDWLPFIPAACLAIWLTELSLRAQMTRPS